MKYWCRILISLLIVYSYAVAQAPDTLWTRTYGGTSDDNCWWGQQTSAGEYLLVGYTQSFGVDSFDVFAVRIDSVGDTIWTKTYGGTGSDQGIAATLSYTSEFIISGWTTSYGNGGSDIWLLCIDSLGDTLWTKTIGSTGNEICRAIQPTSDTGFIITGSTTSFGAGLRDLYLVKTNSSGDTLWTQVYGGVDNEHGYSLQETFDGGYIVAGITKSENVPSAVEIK